MNCPISADVILAHTRARESACRELADRIWERPELSFQETYACGLHAQLLAENGFAVTRDAGGIPTALIAEAGKGGPLIGFMGEYDALATLSQEAGAVECRSAKPGGPGHGCGHHLLGAAAVLAALVTRDVLAEAGIPGRVRYYGCPAEEFGSGKTFMVRAGLFADLDAAISWHPSDANFALYGSWMANVQAHFRFHGRSSHAALSPAMGRSALDAVELMNVGVNFLREHMESDCRVHYAITNSGGSSANVVQSFAEVAYTIRAATNSSASALFERVKKIADGAALMTETTMEMEIDTATSDLLPNRVLSEVMHGQLRAFGPSPFDGSDLAYARTLQQTIEPRAVKNSDATRSGRADDALLGEILPLGDKEILLPVSGDIGDVSWTVPTTQCLIACYAVGTQQHSWQVVAQGKSPAAHKGMTLAANAMAATALSAFSDPDILQRARDEWRVRGGESYCCPIPDDVLPPPLRAPA